MTSRTAAHDFREFVRELVDSDDAVVIDRLVDPDLEVGAISRRVYETRSPAPLFAALKGVEPGFRILGAPAGLAKDPHPYRRLAAHLGLEPSASGRQIVETLVAAMRAEPVPPVEVSRCEAPCKQNVWTGDQVDLTRFPAPLLHQQDGGRYLGTYGFHIVQSADGNWTSWSVARAMLGGRRTVVGPVIPQQHIGVIHKMWRQRGERMPWAMVLGGPPAALIAAGMPLPEQISEDGYVGALAGSPVEVVRAETNALLVPATSEIVLEGYLDITDERAPEGPMAEYHGYSFPGSKEQPVFHVEAVTFRDDPILPVCTAGLPPEENHTIWGTMIAAAALDVLQAGGLPIDMAWCSYEAATCWLVLSVDLEQLANRRTTEARLAEEIASVLFTSHAGGLVPKVLLVGNDVDITDIDQVVWALATRHHPVAGHHVFPHAHTFPLVPYMTPSESAVARGGDVVISCLFPEQFEGNSVGQIASFSTSYPAEIRERVLASWKDYGFPV